MAQSDFNALKTVKFQQKMKPAAIRIYQHLFSGCEVEDLRENGVKVHVLDKEFGIDCLLNLDGGQWISVQEKYRHNKYLSNPRLRVMHDQPDFTQEYKNAAGTKYESNGEWFKLGAQLYFYGWANKDETDFEKWAILDVAKYKMIVDQSGGLERIGKLQNNSQHGRASFFCIPISKLKDAFVYTYRDLVNQ